MPGVRVERVTKVYDGDVLAVDDVSLEIAPGEFMVLVGPSGCGKSTLLRLMAGLEQVTKGRVWIGDEDVTTLEPPDRDVAMVFQSYALYPHRRRRSSISRSSSTASRRICPAASASGSRWGGRWSASRARS